MSSTVSGPPSAEARLSVAARASVEPFHVMDVWVAATERQRTHGDLVNLSAGQPSTPAPAPVRAAATSALASDVLGYTVAVGVHELRAAIAEFYQRRYQVSVDADDVVATTGSSGGFLLCFLAGANSIFYGERLLTTPNPAPDEDRDLLRELGLKAMQQPAHVH